MHRTSCCWRSAGRTRTPLFFNRRLVMEGDTELGLVVKNALDAIELPVLDPRHWAPRAVLARWAPGLAERLAPLPPFFSRERP